MVQSCQVDTSFISGTFTNWLLHNNCHYVLLPFSRENIDDHPWLTEYAAEKVCKRHRRRVFYTSSRSRNVNKHSDYKVTRNIGRQKSFLACYQYNIIVQ